MNEELYDIKDEGAMGDDWPSVIRDENSWIEGGSMACLLKEAFFCVYEIERLLKSVTAKLSHGAGCGISSGEWTGP